MDQKENLKQFLLINEREIIPKWYKRMIESYPPEMRNFWENNENRFTQPVPYTMTLAMQKIYRELIKPLPNEQWVYSELESMMRICAVQNLRPSDAVRVFFQLKDIIREEAVKTETLDSFLEIFQKIEEYLDQWILRAFDIYMEFREKIYELRMKEIRNQMRSEYSQGNGVTE
jgi:hypothetical protein